MVEYNLNPQNKSGNNEVNPHPWDFVVGFWGTISAAIFLTPFLMGLFAGIFMIFDMPDSYAFPSSYAGVFIVYILLLVWAYKKKRKEIVRGSLIAFFSLIVLPLLLFGACMLAVTGFR